MNEVAVQALLFDVFGTVVDWRRSVIRQVKRAAEEAGVSGDWAQFVDEWRRGYHEGMRLVNSGQRPWMNVERIHRLKLDELLPKYGLDSLDEDRRRDLNLAWHRLDPWPDAVEGLTRLKRGFLISPLSNGNVRLLADMAKWGGLPWDLILSAELGKVYKPDRRAYLYAAELLALSPDRLLMVAAHSSDLRAAKSAGLKVALVTRPDEFGSGGKPDLEPDPDFEYFARDFNDLAGQLGC